MLVSHSHVRGQNMKTTKCKPLSIFTFRHNIGPGKDTLQANEPTEEDNRTLEKTSLTM